MSDLKVELIRPFIDAVHATFETMLQMKVSRKRVYLKKGYDMAGDISGIIGMSGDTAGTCAISLPEALAVHVVEKMVMEKIEGGMQNVVVRDGVGELINMIAGGAKTTLSYSKYKFDITLPTIISGANHEVFHRKGTHCVVIVFGTPTPHEFTLDVAVQEMKH